MADHISIRKAPGTWTVRAGGAVLGESQNALELTEGDYPFVIYFPRDDIAMAFLDRTDKTTHCPHKGDANYFSVVTKSATLGIRLGMHYGPVYERLDPVLERTNVFGFHVSKAARIEPITPEGEIYVTDAAAAALAVEALDAFRCDYVGRVPLAKGYGEFPMYALERRSG